MAETITNVLSMQLTPRICAYCKHVLKTEITIDEKPYVAYFCQVCSQTITVCDMKKVEHEILTKAPVNPRGVCDLFKENDETRETTD